MTEVIRYATVPTSLGLLLVATSADGVCEASFGADEDELVAACARRFAGAALKAADTRTRRLAAAIASAVESPATTPDIELDLRGTPFQQAVWAELRQVPCGTTVTYGELARRIGRPTATRAVAQACGANPVAVVVPCHRVIGSDGSLTGYASGIDRKRALLEREGAI